MLQNCEKKKKGGEKSNDSYFIRGKQIFKEGLFEFVQKVTPKIPAAARNSNKILVLNALKQKIKIIKPHSATQRV